MGRAAADNRSRGKSSSNTQRGNAARRKSHSGGTKVIQALDCQSKPFSWGSKGAFSFAKENGPFDSHPCAAQGYPRCTCAANSQLLYNLLTLCPFHFKCLRYIENSKLHRSELLESTFLSSTAAGKKDSRQRVYAMAEALKRNHNLDVECMLTKSRGHATALTRAIAETGDYVRFTPAAATARSTRSPTASRASQRRDDLHPHRHGQRFP